MQMNAVEVSHFFLILNFVCVAVTDDLSVHIFACLCLFALGGSDLSRNLKSDGFAPPKSFPIC